MEKTFYTIGYEGAEIGDFVATLLHFEIDTLIDIRDVPLSRKRGFAKSALAEILRANSVEYVHLKGLGDPKEGREAAKAGYMEKFRSIFERHMRSGDAQADLAVAERIVNTSTACLLCFERDPKRCHRTIVADHLVELTGKQRQSLGVRAGLAKQSRPTRSPDEQSGA